MINVRRESSRLTELVLGLEARVASFEARCEPVEPDMTMESGAAPLVLFETAFNY